MKSQRKTTGTIATARDLNALRADAAGGGNLFAHAMLGILKIPTAPTNGQTVTLTVNGSAITVTFVTGTPTNANDVKAGASGTATAENLRAFLHNPSANNTNQVAASAANQQLLSYLGSTAKDANVPFYTLNNVDDAPLTSFSVTTNVTGATYEVSTLKVYIEPGIFYIGTTKVEFTGSPTGTFTAASANPRIDLLTIDSAGAIGITAGSEGATPSAPAYPTDKVVVCEVYNKTTQTEIRDNDNTGTPQGYILKDTRPFNSIIYINDNAQIAAGVILQSNLGNAGTVPTGTVIQTALPTGTTVAGWLECTGTAVSRTTYAALYGAIGTTFGAGNGTTTFNLPDLRGRIPLGAGTGAGDGGSGTGTPTGTPLTARALGAWGGKESHMPAHTHTVDILPSQDSEPGGSGNTPWSQAAASSTGSAGDSSASNTLQPFLVLTFFIKI